MRSGSLKAAGWIFPAVKGAAIPKKQLIKSLAHLSAVVDFPAIPSSKAERFFPRCE